MALVSALYHVLVRSKKGAKFGSLQMYRRGKGRHTLLYGQKVLMAFLHNRLAKSYEILSECSHQ